MSLYQHCIRSRRISWTVFRCDIQLYHRPHSVSENVEHDCIWLLDNRSNYLPFIVLAVAALIKVIVEIDEKISVETGNFCWFGMTTFLRLISVLSFSYTVHSWRNTWSAEDFQSVVFDDWVSWHPLDGVIKSRNPEAFGTRWSMIRYAFSD